MGVLFSTFLVRFLFLGKDRNNSNKESATSFQERECVFFLVQFGLYTVVIVFDLLGVLEKRGVGGGGG